MNRTKNILLRMIVGALLLGAGVSGGWWWARHGAMPTQASAGGGMTNADEGGNEAPTEGKALYWYDPMYPQQHFDKPGKSPFMDMQLVPKYAEAGGSGGLKIDPKVRQSLGIRLARVERIPLSMRVEATGLIGFNEREVAVVQVRSGGFVERVWPLAPGDVIRAGQPLVQLLVPEWAAAQHEFLAVRGMHDADLSAAARDRLRLLGMPEGLIREVEASGQPQSRYTVRSPIGGALQEWSGRVGMTLAAGQTVARVNGLSTVWLDVSVPEAQAMAAKRGTPVEARLAAFPGRMFEGRVQETLPSLDPSTRSLRARIELANRDGRLRPGLTAQVMLASASNDTALAVPTEAIIRTGKRALVMQAFEDGSFNPVEVMPGREVGDRTVVVSGLQEGQEVVASGQFLLDSEASLSGITARRANGMDSRERQP